MSRLDTQSDRLIRGPSGFEQQRSFLVQPQRFAAPNQTRVDQIVAGLAQVSGQLVQAQEQKSAKVEAAKTELERARFNEYFVELSRLEDLYKAEPTPENRNNFLAYRSDGFTTFGTDTQYAVDIERRTLSGADIAGKAAEELNKSIQGGYQITVQRRIDEQVNDPEFVSRLSEMPYPQARAELEKEVLQNFSEEQLENFSAETYKLLNSKVREGLNGDIKARRQAREKTIEDNLKAASLQNLQSSIDLAEDTGDIIEQVRTHSDEHNVPVEDTIDTLVENRLSDIKTQLQVGDSQSLSESVSQLDKLLPLTNDQQREQVAKAVADTFKLHAAQESARFVEVSDMLLTSLKSKIEVKESIDILGVDVYNAKFGTTFAVDRLEEVRADNKNQQVYLDELVRGRDTALQDYEKKAESSIGMLDTLSNPANATRSEINAVITADATERQAAVEVYSQQLFDYEGPLTEEDLARIEDIQILLNDAKTDPAAWGEVVSILTEDTQHYNTAFDTMVKGPLSESGIPSQDTLRTALAFVRNSRDFLVESLHGDEKTIYALSSLQRHVTNSPNEQDLSGVYQGFLDEWEGVRFKAKGQDGGIPIGELMTKPKFIEALVGTERAGLSNTMKANIASIINVSAIEGGDRPELVGRVVKEALQKSGLYVISRETGGSVRASIISSNNIPESFGVSTLQMEQDLLKDRSQAVTFFTNQLAQQNGSERPNILGLIRDAAADSELVIPEEYSSLLKVEEMRQHVDDGRIRLHIASEQSDGGPIPVMAVLDNQDGRQPIAIPLGFIDMSNYASVTNPMFFKDPKETNMPRPESGTAWKYYR